MLCQVFYFVILKAHTSIKYFFITTFKSHAKLRCQPTRGAGSRAGKRWRGGGGGSRRRFKEDDYYDNDGSMMMMTIMTVMVEGSA